MGSTNEAAVEPEQRFSESKNAGSGNEDSEDQTSGKGRLKAEELGTFVTSRLMCNSPVENETKMVVRRSVLGFGFRTWHGTYGVSPHQWWFMPR